VTGTRLKLTVTVAAILVLAAAVTVGTKTDDRRRAKIQAYWTPASRTMQIHYSFGNRAADASDTGAIKGAPFQATGYLEVQPADGPGRTIFIRFWVQGHGWTEWKPSTGTRAAETWGPLVF
jgi:hypothetical protein